MKDKVIVEFCKEIKTTSSIKEKKAILSKYENDETIKTFLEFLYNKLIVTGISSTRIKKKIDRNIDFESYYTLLDVLQYLKTNNTGSDKDIATVQYYLDTVKDEFTSDDMKIIEKIITKQLRIGIDVTLINKVIPNLIPVHEVQQANSLKNVKLNDGEWICLSEKINGNRATYINGKLYSRQGKTFNHIEHIENELNMLQTRFPCEMVFDGEIRRKNIDNLTDNENFSIGTGILNSDQEDKTELEFILFDLLPRNEFYNKESTETYKQRYATMLEVGAYLRTMPFNYLKVVPFLYAGTDHSQIKVCLDKMDSEGKEGCMLARNETYKCKRHNGLLKVKTFYTMDLPIVGFENGTGKNENTLGKVIVDFKGNHVGVGSGFTDEERNWFWENRDLLRGRIIEVKYKDISKDKNTGKESLQFPVFVQLREIGKEKSFY